MLRKFSRIISAFLILSITINAYSQSADYSRPVGLIKIEIQPGTEKLSSTPFDAFDPSINGLILGQLTGGNTHATSDQIIIWDTTLQTPGDRSAFLAGSTGDDNKNGKWYKDFTSWDLSDMSISTGMGFRIKNNQLAQQKVFLTGLVPLDATRTVTLQPDINLFAYPFASKISLNGASLKFVNGVSGGMAQNAADIISTVSPDPEHWLYYNPPDTAYSDKWVVSLNNVSTLELKPGAGYWYDRLGLLPLQWIENLPYQNLFDVTAVAPLVTDMTFPVHDEVMLHVDCTGAPGEILEVFYKDVADGESLVTESGWKMAAQNLMTNGLSEITWTDEGKAADEFPLLVRPKISNVFMRVYIVSRQDIDSDNDGLSNGRELFVYGTNPSNPDWDGDLLKDGEEVNTYRTNPKVVDSDGDGVQYNDYVEVKARYPTDPNDPAKTPATLPSFWSNYNVGASAPPDNDVPGTSTTYYDGLFTVAGAGTLPASSKPDKFRYCYQTRTLDVNCEVKALVTQASQENTSSTTKAGIMIRKDTSDSTQYVFAYLSPYYSGTPYFLRRETVGANAAANLAGGTANLPCWVKITKSGNSYTPYQSMDGSSWTQIGTAPYSVAMGDSVLVGFASANTALTGINTGKFDNFSIALTDTPVITQTNPSGYFQMSQQVSMDLATTADSEIWYTVGSSLDTAANIPVQGSPSIKYEGPFDVTASCVIKARRFKTDPEHPELDYAPSPVSVKVFNQPGLMVKYYDGNGLNWTEIPDFTGTPYMVSMIPNLDYPETTGHIMTSGRDNNVAALVTGKIYCPIDASYTFYLLSGEGSRLYIDDSEKTEAPLIERNGIIAFGQSYHAITLTKGFHDIRLEYFEASGTGGIQLKWAYTGQSAIIMPNTAFFSPDTELDGLPDQWEIFKFTNLAHSGTDNSDPDGISDKEELNFYFTDPFDDLQPFAPKTPSDAAAGIAVSYCAKNNRTWAYVPEFEYKDSQGEIHYYLPHFGTSTVGNINFGSTTTVPFATGVPLDNFAAYFRGYINITAPGLYKFYIDCDAGANLYIDGKRIVNNDGLHTTSEEYGYASLKTGKHEISVDYYETTSYSKLILQYEGPDAGSKLVVPASVLFHSTQYVSNMSLPASNDADSDGLVDPLDSDDSDWDSVNATNLIMDGDRVELNPPTGDLPSGWEDLNIGSSAGSANYEASVFTLRNKATILSPVPDIYGASDSLNYCYQDLYGDCEVVVRVISLPNTNAFAKAGLMIRESLDAGSRNAFVFVTPSNGANFQYRATTASTTTRVAGAGSATAPYWLKLVKTGNIYAAYQSQDGSNWTLIDSNQTVAIGNVVKVGFAVTSMNGSIPDPVPVKFDNFSITRTLTAFPSISGNPTGYFQGARTVTIADSVPAVPGTVMRYTSDSSDPVSNSPTYSVGQTIIGIAGNADIKTRLYKDGYLPGPITQSFFTGNPSLMVKYYDLNCSVLPTQPPTGQPYKVSMIPDINFPSNKDGAILTSDRADYVYAEITGQVYCPISGSYTFYLISSDGSALDVDGTRLLTNDGVQAMVQVYAARVLTPGMHDIKVSYFNSTGTTTGLGGLQLKWAYTGHAADYITPDEFFCPDTDLDGLPDQWEKYKYGENDLSHSGTEDADQDGWTNAQELNLYMTDPDNAASTPAAASNPANTTANGLVATYCAMNARAWTQVPDLPNLPKYGATAVNNINYARGTGAFATSGVAINIGAMFKGYIEVPTSGIYKFYINCEDGANLYIDGKPVVYNDGLHAIQETYGIVGMEAGKHEIRVDYYQTTSYNSLIVSYEGPGISKLLVPSTVLSYSNQYLADMLAENDPDSDGVHTITASAGANGSISPSGTITLNYMDNQGFTITPHAGHEVSDVLVDNVSVGAVTSYQFTDIRINHTISASFMELKLVRFVEGVGGTISGDKIQKVNHGGNCAQVIAVPNTGYHFVNWTSNGSVYNTEAALTVSNVNQDMTFIANFAINADVLNLNLSVSPVNCGYTNPVGSIGVSSGVATPISVTPVLGYHFTTWSSTGGVFENTALPETTVSLTSDATVTANFTLNPLNLFGMGRNSYGEIGDGTTTERHSPVQSTLSSVSAISTGGFYSSLCIKGDGSLWAVGANNNGQLGDGTTTNRSIPVQIIPSGVVAISAGYNHGLFLKDDGSLWGMGDNACGELGDGTTTERHAPVQIVPSGVSAISAGYYYSLFLKNDGSLWSMGYNGYGQLGDGSTTVRHAPVQIVSSGVSAISAGNYHSLFLKNDGSMWAMGNNAYGQFGNGTTTEQHAPVQIVSSGVSAISAGFYFSLFLRNDGSMWAMGYNNSGQLGDGTTTNRYNPVQVESSGVSDISAGYYHSLFLKDNGSLWAMGDNMFGRLGDGTTTDRHAPVQIMSSGISAISAGYYHSLFLKNGTYTVSFVEGTGGTITGERLQTVNPDEDCSQVIAIPNIGYHFVSWTRNETVYSTDATLTVRDVQDMTLNANFAINPGLCNLSFAISPSNCGNITPRGPTGVTPGVAAQISAMAYPRYHFLNWTSTGGVISNTCLPETSITLTDDAILTANFYRNNLGLFGMGQNNSGQLGDGTTTNRHMPVEIAPTGIAKISIGGGYSLFLKDDGSLWGMGHNACGELGDGTTIQRNTPVQIVTSGVLAISAGSTHSLFLKDDGSLWAMGNNNQGQLGDGTITQRNTPVQIVSSGVSAISAGGSHSLFLKNDGSLWAMGNNNQGQLGDGTTTQRNTPVQIVTSGVLAISAGSYHSMLLKDNGSLWAMGDNQYGSLGDGTTTDRYAPVQIMSSGISAISAGSYHSMFLKTDDSMWAMGCNAYGQLGDGTTTTRYAPVQIMPSGVSAISAGSHSLFLKNGTCTVTFTAGEGGTITGEKIQIVTSDEECSQVIAVPNAGFHFVNWTRNGVFYSSDANLTVTCVQDMTITAKFEINPGLCKLSINALPASKGSVNPEGSIGVAPDEPTSISATAVSGCHFVNWTGTGGSIDNVASPETTVTLTDDATVTANFILNSQGLFGMGNNANARLGDGTIINRYSPVQTLSYGVAAVSAGTWYTYFIKDDGSLWGTGWSPAGILSNGATGSIKTPVQIISEGMMAISAGPDHIVLLKANGSLWTGGDNSQGQLGDGTTNDSSIPIQIISSGVAAILAAPQNTFFIKDDGSLWGMGDNHCGQLGDGTTTNRLEPIQIAPSGIVAVSAGSYHCLFLKNDGSLWGMGNNGQGQLGQGTATYIYTPVQILNSGVTAIACGYSHSLFIKSDKSLWAMGKNSYGQLGVGSTSNMTTPVIVLSSDVKAISAGCEHSMFIKQNGSLWTMGRNNAGQLGDGTTTDRNTPVQIVESMVTAISAGNVHSVFLADGNYTVTFIDGANGTLTGEKTQTVSYGGSTQAVTVVPNVGYHFVNWTKDGVEYSTSQDLTVSNVIENMAVTANFAINTYTVTFVEGANGTITGNNVQSVIHGTNCTAVTAVPDTGYHFVDWTGDVISINNPLTLTNVTSNKTITANFYNLYTISASAGANGTISPVGDVAVIQGTNPAFTITPAPGYHVSDVLVDGVSVGAITRYKFFDVQSARTISASFTLTDTRFVYVDSAQDDANDGLSREYAKKTISAALAICSDDDVDIDYVVLVADGTYAGELNTCLEFNGKNIKLKSENGYKKTIIDGGYTSFGVAMNSGESDRTMIDGFTFKNCHTAGYGAAIFLDNASSPKIINCKFTGNYSECTAGAIYANGGTPVIESCIFEDNYAYGNGGAVMLIACDLASLKTSSFLHNTAGNSGAAVYAINSEIIIENSVITKNTTLYGNSALSADSSETDKKTVISNCTIVKNETGQHGISLATSTPSVCVNTILRDNDGMQIRNDTGTMVTYCNTVGFSGAGNIDADPIFADVDNNNIHITADSPCIDMGTISYSPASDIDGDQRPTGPGVDIGADEYVVMAAGISVTPIQLVIPENGGTASLEVVLDGQPAQDVIISCSANQADVTLDHAALLFTSANWNLPQTIVVTAVNDAIHTERATAVTLSVDDTNSDPVYANLEDITICIALIDDEIPDITLTPSSKEIIEGTNGTVAVSLTAKPFQNVILDMSSTDVTKATVSSSTLTFTPDNWNIPQDVSISALDDQVSSNGYAEIIVAVDTQSSDAEFINIMPKTVAVVIIDAGLTEDTDSDGLPDDWELEEFGNLSQAAAGDFDNDGVSNIQEFLHHTNPNACDTDGDGINDATEIASGTNPCKTDSDGDGIPDGTDANPNSVTDSDSDGLPDDWEMHYFNSINYGANDDPDGDGVSNLLEYQLGRNPEQGALGDNGDILKLRLFNN